MMNNEEILTGHQQMADWLETECHKTIREFHLARDLKAREQALNNLKELQGRLGVEVRALALLIKENDL